MNRIIILLFALFLSISTCWAQDTLNNRVKGLRTLLTDMNLPNAQNVELLCSWNDSLANRIMEWKISYDSLMRDSVALIEIEREIVLMDAALIQYYINPSAQNYLKVKTLFLASNALLDNSSTFTRELYAIMREMSAENVDYTVAYSLQNKLHALDFKDWLEHDKLSIALSDSLQTVIDRNETVSADALAHSRSQTMQWHISAMIAIAAAVVMLTLILFLRYRWKRRMLELVDKANDKSEEETLVQKLEQARREIIELKSVAKRQVETANRETVSPVPSSSSLSPSEISHWNDQIQQALAKIKSHCESGKSSMGVPTYMSIVNDTGRLGTLVQQKSEEWIALLNAKMDSK